MKGQKQKHSVLEAAINVATGMVVAFSISQLAAHYEPEIQKYIYKDFAWSVGLSSNIAMTGILTTVSILRSYVWRRVFNHIHLKGHNESKD